MNWRLKEKKPFSCALNIKAYIKDYEFLQKIERYLKMGHYVDTDWNRGDPVFRLMEKHAELREMVDYEQLKEVQERRDLK
jgi:hypothetical protein